MKNGLNTDWILNLPDMWPTPELRGDVAYQKIEQTAEYVRKESHGALEFNTLRIRIIQKAPLPWSYIFDIIKKAPKVDYSKIRFTILFKWPLNFTPRRPEPEPETMYATYDSGKDAILLQVLTGDYIEHRGDDDGFGVEPDEHEVLQGLRDRDGNWIEELRLKWI